MRFCLLIFLSANLWRVSLCLTKYTAPYAPAVKKILFTINNWPNVGNLELTIWYEFDDVEIVFTGVFQDVFAVSCRWSSSLTGAEAVVQAALILAGGQRCIPRVVVWWWVRVDVQGGDNEGNGRAGGSGTDSWRRHWDRRVRSRTKFYPVGFSQSSIIASVVFSAFFRRFRRVNRRNSELDEKFGWGRLKSGWVRLKSDWVRLKFCWVSWRFW